MYVERKFSSSRYMHFFGAKGVGVFSISCTCINCRPRAFLIKLIAYMFAQFKVKIEQLLVVSLFKHQIINSLNSSFSCKDRNIRGIEILSLKTLYVWLYPQLLPIFSVVPTLDISTKILYQFTCRKQANKYFNVDIVILSIIYQIFFLYKTPFLYNICIIIILPSKIFDNNVKTSMNVHVLCAC